jgi:protein phosphatase
MGTIQTHSLSIQGRRESNQDSCIVLKPTNESVFLAIADGMGGVAGGQVASQTIIECCKGILTEVFKSEVKPTQLKEVLISIFYQAQKHIKKKIEENPQLNGMGTTLACVLILNDSYVWGSLGDSRIYLISNSKIYQITSDHTHIQEYLNQHDGKISDQILSNYSHYLTRTIDGGTDEPDIFPDVVSYEQLSDGDTLLLCSDGLILNKADNDEDDFLNYLLGTKNLETAAENMIGRAYAKGSNDNITAILCEYGSLKREKVNLKQYKIPGDRKIKSNLLNKVKINSKEIISIIIFIAFLIVISFYLGLF